MGETMPFDEYRKVALETASYEPVDGISFLYPAVGIIGELGEVSDVIKKLWRDSDGVLDHSWRYKLVMEIGDALWFVVALEKEFNTRVLEWSDDTGKCHPMLIVLQMNQASGAMSECIRNICLSEPSHRLRVSETLKSEINKYLGTIFFCLVKLAQFIEVPLEEIFAANIQKLQYRRSGGQQKYR